MQSLNKNGVSITQTPGEEKFVKCRLGAFRGQIYYQYDYRHTDGEPISRIDRSVFEDVETWGVCSLQGWVNSYESVRFVAIDDHTAIITGEYNMEQVKVWLEKYTSIKSLKTS